MSASTVALYDVGAGRRILRYALGSVLAVGISVWGDWTFAYLTPVLVLMFIGSPTPAPSLKQGIGFIAVIVVSTMFGVALTRFVLPYPSVFIPMVFVIMFHIFYARPTKLPPLLKVFMLITLSAIPLLGLQSGIIVSAFAFALVGNGIATVFIAWLIYGLIPDPPKVIIAEAAKPKGPAPSRKQQAKMALVSTLVVYPIFLAFYFFEWLSMLIVLIFSMILAMQPGFAKNFKAGILLVLANVAGGIAAIIVYEILVMVPMLTYYLMLVALVGLYFGGRLFSKRPTAALYGTAFSTFLVIIGSTTGGDSEADAKAYSRIFQIMLAVIYVVVASGVITALVDALFGKDPDHA